MEGNGQLTPEERRALLFEEQEPADPAKGPVPRDPGTVASQDHYDMHVPDITEGESE